MIDLTNLPRARAPFRFALLAAAGLLVFGCSSDEEPAASDDSVADDAGADGGTTEGAASDEGGDAAEGSAVEIVSVSDAFSPASLTVAVGTEVTWTNADTVDHTVTAEDGGFDSDALSGGGTFSTTFEEAGTFAYFCAIHPSMTGEIVVE